MAKCPGCDCELTGLDRLCRECFDKEYAVVARKGGFPARSLRLPLMALGVSLYSLLAWYFPNAVDRVHEGFHAILKAVATLGFILTTVFGIFDSLEWRTIQKLTFWTLIGLNLAGLWMWRLREDVHWASLCLISFLISSALSAYYKQRLV